MTESTVTLTQEEMARAARVAKDLHDRLRNEGKKDAHGFKADAVEMQRIEAGASQAELAVAKFYEVKWSAENPDNGPYGPDVGDRTQVRSSGKPRKSHNLMVRPWDLKKYGNVPFVLVIQDGEKFTIKGWAMSEDVINHGWLYNTPGRPAVHMLPESKLKPPESLKSEDV